MRYSILPKSKPSNNPYEWHRWFAWFPVDIEQPNMRAWLEVVWRRAVQATEMGYVYKYRSRY